MNDWAAAPILIVQRSRSQLFLSIRFGRATASTEKNRDDSFELRMESAQTFGGRERSKRGYALYLLPYWTIKYIRSRISTPFVRGPYGGTALSVYTTVVYHCRVTVRCVMLMVTSACRVGCTVYRTRTDGCCLLLLYSVHIGSL